MSNKITNACPAGAESDGSDVEWDLGFPSPKETADTAGLCAGVIGEEDEVTKLKRAIDSGNVHLVQELLDNGMDTDTRLCFDWTPLMCAVHLAHYELAVLLLNRGASANFSKDQYTVLMAAVTASASEDKIVKCVELLLSRNADTNTFNKTSMTCLMLAAREGYSQVINLLVSQGAEVNAQDSQGNTALMMAVQYGREQAVLKLLQLGADKSIKNRTDATAGDLAAVFKQAQICRILASHDNTHSSAATSKDDNLYKFFNRNPDESTSKESLGRLCDMDLLLHGLNLEHLSDIMKENDVTWSYLLTMEKDDLEKIGVTDPGEQENILSAVQEMQQDSVDMETLNQLENIDSGSEELYNFLISLRQQCCYLTETVQDVNTRFPRQASQLVFSLDPKGEAQALCKDLVAQIGDLQKEVSCLHNLLCKMDDVGRFCAFPQPGSHGQWRRRALKGFSLSMLGAGLLFLLSKAKKVKVYF